ncbi:MAG TPA: hypothetical protein PLN48_09535 [Lachnospiraceae bacterium]|nr:hypothetical protein [Lachnospiraceae bacterium]HUM84005.1 hypothetical protein [Lachnospiraceae bacterium]
MMENEPRMTQRILIPTANGYEPHDAASLQSLRRTFWIDGPFDSRQATDAVNMLMQFDADSNEEIE